MHTQSRFGACTDQSALTRCRDGTHKSLDGLRLLRHASEAKPRRTRHAAPGWRRQAPTRRFFTTCPACHCIIDHTILQGHANVAKRSLGAVCSQGGSPPAGGPPVTPAAGSPSARARASSTRVSDRRPAQRPGQASREQWPSLITSSRSSTSYSPVAYCTLQHRTMGRGTAGQGMRSERLRPGGHHR